jgi:hypothetical protein
MLFPLCDDPAIVCLHNVNLNFPGGSPSPSSLSRFDVGSRDPSAVLVVVPLTVKARRARTGSRPRQTVGSRVATMIGLPCFGQKFVADTGEVALVKPPGVEMVPLPVRTQR